MINEKNLNNEPIIPAASNKQKELGINHKINEKEEVGKRLEGDKIKINTKNEIHPQESRDEIFSSIEDLIAGDNAQIPESERDAAPPAGLVIEKPAIKKMPDPDIIMPIVEENFRTEFQNDEGKAAELLTNTINNLKTNSPENFE